MTLTPRSISHRISDHTFLDVTRYKSDDDKVLWRISFDHNGQTVLVEDATIELLQNLIDAETLV